MDTINLNKKVYAKNQYERVIDTKFSQLATSVTPSSQVDNTAILIREFFQMYNDLFFQIPKEGEINSHEYLVKTSSEYINFTPVNEDIQALIDEINILQQTNLELNQQIIELSSQTANNISTNTTLTNNTTSQTAIATRGRG